MKEVHPTTLWNFSCHYPSLSIHPNFFPNIFNPGLLGPWTPIAHIGEPVSCILVKRCLFNCYHGQLLPIKKNNKIRFVSPSTKKLFLKIKLGLQTSQGENPVFQSPIPLVNASIWGCKTLQKVLATVDQLAQAIVFPAISRKATVWKSILLYSSELYVS